ncbi:MAG: peptide ABC transporter substrate-binding protein [Chlamydiales bacterium]
MSSKKKLQNRVRKTLKRFPKMFDVRLAEGLDRVAVNAPSNFIQNRSSSHLLLLLITQFFLQNKMERAIQKENSPFFVRLFRQKPHLCLMVFLPISENEYVLGKPSLLKAIQRLVPSIQEVSGSCFRWLHPELPYSCLYIEVQKLRGRELSSKEIRSLGSSLEEQLLHFIPSYNSALFWPFNEEEAYKQIQILQKEIHQDVDLPQVMINFQKQSKFKLEFLITLVRPQSEICIHEASKTLPSSVDFFYHFFQGIGRLEAWCFSLAISSQPFYETNAINLLYARRHIAKYVEKLVGAFRDFNGGLLEQQQEKFGLLKTRLANVIPDFHLFAEKVFYALQPIEARLALSFENAKKIFMAFSVAIKERSHLHAMTYSEEVLIVKMTNYSALFHLINKVKTMKEPIVYVQLSLSEVHYLCILSRKNMHFSQLEMLLTQPTQQPQRQLRLTFQEGEPPSLNPHYAFGDMRCRILSKLLFEGLTRIDMNGDPKLASAKTMSCSEDGLVYIFKLRSYCWSNGEKLTAFQFVESWQSILLNPNFAGHLESFFVIKNAESFLRRQCSAEELGIHAHDAETLEIQLEWPDPLFLHKLAQPTFFPTIGNTQEPVWFNGPYLIQNHDYKKIVLECNPYYWAHSHIFFKHVHIDYIMDIETSYHLFLEGKIDWMGSPFCTLPSTMVVKLQEREILKKQSVALSLLAYLNTQSSFLRSVKIRKALSLVINRDFITQHIFPHNTPLYKPLPRSLSLAPKTLADDMTNPAKQLFEAGLKEIDSPKKSSPSLILCYPNTPGYKQLAEYLQETWEAAFGILVNLQESKWNVFRSNLEKGEFQIAISGMGALYSDPFEPLERFESAKTANFSQWTNPAFQEKLYLARKNPQKRAHLLGQAEQLLMDEMPFIPICNFDALFAYNPQLKGFVFDHVGCIDFRWAYLENENV